MARLNRRRDRTLWRLPAPRALAASLGGAVRQRRRVLMAIAIGLVGVGALVGAAAWLMSSPRFEIRQVETSGQKLLPKASLLERIALEEERNLFRFNAEAAEARLEASVWIKNATIRRSFPDGLEVELEENVPAAVALLGELYLIDGDGVAFKRASTAEAAELGQVVITGVSAADYRERMEASSALLAEAIAVAALWSLESTRPALDEVHVDPVRGFSLIPSGGAPVIQVGLGPEDALQRRIALFDRIWPSLSATERATAEFIHLETSDAPNRVTIAFHDDIRDRLEKQETWPN